MSRNRGNGFFWFIFLLFMFGGGSVFPLLLIIGVVMAITMAAVNGSRKQESRDFGYQRGYTRTQNYYRPSQQKYSPAQMARVNVYLRNYFRSRRSLPISSNISLRIHGQRYASLASLDVYRDGAFVCSLSDFGRRYPDSYDEILRELVSLAEEQREPEVFEAEVVTPVQKPEVKEEPKEEPKQEERVDYAQKFIQEISSLNDSIPDEDISNGLYETCALLKQIDTLEEKFPDSRDKLKKLYDYYLPIMVRILVQYDNLQAAKTDPSYEETRIKLNRTIQLINDAMKTIISSMTDQDFINLTADISTLEAVLQKDGLTNEGKMETRRY